MRPHPSIRSVRRARGRSRYVRGLEAEALAVAALVADGWEIKARRQRTRLGEIDIVAAKEGLLAFVEVKARPSLRAAAEALSERQRMRLAAAAAVLLAAHPEWGDAGVRFDVIIIDERGALRRIPDAFRPG